MSQLCSELTSFQFVADVGLFDPQIVAASYPATIKPSHFAADLIVDAAAL